MVVTLDKVCKDVREKKKKLGGGGGLSVWYFV